MAGEYQQTATVPANTSALGYVSTLIKVSNPLLTGLDVYFPPGCAGLCYVALFVNGAQVLPDPNGSNDWYHGEGTVGWIGTKRLSTGQASYYVEMRAYNLDDTYDHHPIYRLDTSGG